MCKNVKAKKIPEADKIVSRNICSCVIGILKKKMSNRLHATPYGVLQLCFLLQIAVYYLKIQVRKML